MNTIHTLINTPFDVNAEGQNYNLGALPIVPGATVYLDANRLLSRSEVATAWQYTWRMVAAPYGSEAVVSYANLVRASFVPDLPGRYLIHLEVSTSRGVLLYPTYVFVDEDLRVAAMDDSATNPGRRQTSWTFQGFTESQWEAMAG